MSFQMSEVEEIPSPKLGFYLEITVADRIETLFFESFTELTKTYLFLRHEYNCEKSSFSYGDDEYVDILIDVIGRDAYEHPNRIIRLRMYQVSYDYGFYRQYFEEV